MAVDFSHPCLIKKVHPKAIVPSYKHPGDSGADLHACLDEEVVIAPGDRALIPTGLSFCISKNLEIQVRPRSGLALKKGVTVLNAPGTIDSGYRSEVGVILFNAGNEDFLIQHGDRIAQMVLCPVAKRPFQVVDELPDTSRGSGGFGSTGV